MGKLQKRILDVAAQVHMQARELDAKEYAAG
jgi:hypothetical protein